MATPSPPCFVGPAAFDSPIQTSSTRLGKASSHVRSQKQPRSAKISMSSLDRDTNIHADAHANAHVHFDRRTALKALLYTSLLPTLTLSPQSSTAAEFRINSLLQDRSTSESTPILPADKMTADEVAELRTQFLKTSFVYTVVPPSELREASVQAAFKLFAFQPNALFLGSHRESIIDHALQANLVREIKLLRDADASTSGPQRMTAVGVEAVQMQHQSVLDSYIKGDISDEEMEKQTKWSSTFAAPFEAYLPVLWICRELEIPLVALAPNDSLLVQVKNFGLDSLNATAKQQIMSDPLGFVSVLADPRFQEYEGFVLNRRGSTLITHEAEDVTAFQHCLADEAFATNVASYCYTHPKTLLISCMGTGRVKFGFGVPGRTDRLLTKMQAEGGMGGVVNGKMKTLAGGATAGTAGSASDAALEQILPKKRVGKKVISVLLNPTTLDSGKDVESGSGKMRLQLPMPPLEGAEAMKEKRKFTQPKELVFADYLWYSNQAPSKVRAQADWRKQR